MWCNPSLEPSCRDGSKEESQPKSFLSIKNILQLSSIYGSYPLNKSNPNMIFSENTNVSDLQIRVLSGPSCSKLTMSLVNVSLKFQMKFANFFCCEYFLLKHVRSFYSAKTSHIFSTKKSVSLVI